MVILPSSVYIYLGHIHHVNVRGCVFFSHVHKFRSYSFGQVKIPLLILGFSTIIFIEYAPDNLDSNNMLVRNFVHISADLVGTSAYPVMCWGYCK